MASLSTTIPSGKELQDQARATAAALRRQPRGDHRRRRDDLPGER